MKKRVIGLIVIVWVLSIITAIHWVRISSDPVATLLYQLVGLPIGIVAGGVFQIWRLRRG